MRLWEVPYGGKGSIFIRLNLMNKNFVICLSIIRSINPLHPSGKMTFANNLDPDEIQQNVGPHLRSILCDLKIIYQRNFRWIAEEKTVTSVG